MLPRPTVRNSLLGGVLGLAALLAGTSPTRADPLAEARILFEQGNRELKQAMRLGGPRREQALDSAIESYVASLALARNRNVLFNTGVALDLRDRPEDAFQYFQEYLGFHDLTERERKDAEERLARIHPRVTVVEVETNPAGAEVRVDRRDIPPRGKTPLVLAVTPDETHTLLISAPGHRDAKAQVTGQRGEVRKLELGLEPSPIFVTVRAPPGVKVLLKGQPVAPNTPLALRPGRHTFTLEPGGAERTVVLAPGQDPATVDFHTDVKRGSLRIEANVGVEAHVDGALLGKGTTIEVELPEGPHEVLVTAPGHHPITSTVDLRAFRRTTLQAHMRLAEEPTSRFGVWPIVAWAATGVGAATALGLSLVALDANNDFEVNPTESEANGVDDKNLRADVLWGVTAGFAITALVLTLLNGEEESPTSTIRIQPAVSFAPAPVPGGGLVTARVPWN